MRVMAPALAMENALSNVELPATISLPRAARALCARMRSRELSASCQRQVPSPSLSLLSKTARAPLLECGRKSAVPLVVISPPPAVQDWSARAMAA